MVVALLPLGPLFADNVCSDGKLYCFNPLTIIDTNLTTEMTHVPPMPQPASPPQPL